MKVGIYRTHLKYFFECIKLILLRAESKSHRDGASWIFTFSRLQ